MDPDELAPWLRLSLTPGVGDQGARKLLAAFGLPAAIFAQSRAALCQVVAADQADALLKPPAGFEPQLSRTSAWLAEGAAHGAVHRIVTLADEDYPPGLLQTADPPLLLYVAAAPGVFLNQVTQGLAMVGSRNPTAQGAQNARAFARALANAGCTVISGLALGVDAAAHEGALEARAAPPVATLAVIGTGIDRVYPAAHRALAHRIVQRGMIVSELPLGTPPLAQNFPKRNRIIAGLSRGTLVVEAALRSGSLITARMAVEQGKDVFAIPGSIHSPQSRGCHALIRQGAKLVESVGDVLEELRWNPAAPGATSSSAPPDASAAVRDEGLLALLGYDPVSLDALCARSGLSAAALQVQLLELELEGRVARLPGGLFQRVGLG